MNGEAGGPGRTLRIGLAVLVLLGLAVLVPRAPWGVWLEWLLERIRDLGPAGMVAMVGLYAVGTVLFLPGSLMTLFTGFAFGLGAGTVIVSLGSTLGATLAFLAGRTLARREVRSRIAGKDSFLALDRAVEREGFTIVLLTRLSPLFPFNLLNYAFGITAVSARDYVLASWIGMLPGALLYVYLGTAARDLAEIVTGRTGEVPAGRGLFWVGLVATGAVTMVLTRLAREALAVRQAPRDGAEGGDP